MRFFIFAVFLYAPVIQAEVVATYTYRKAKKPVEKSITIEEVRMAYDIIQKSTFNPPGQDQFFKDYLRFKMGVEVGLNERKLIKSPGLDTLIVNPFLKQAFHQELYKALAEIKLKRSIEKLDNRASNLSDKRLRQLYANDPEFNLFFIAVNHPINPKPSQVKEAESRALKIYNQVIKSKKPFLELVALYSDDKVNGTLGINRSRASILPSVYERLKSMKDGEISRPLRVFSGFFIVKLNKKIPFSEANTIGIKANYFNKERTKIFNNYFDNLKKDFSVKIVKPQLIKTL